MNDPIVQSIAQWQMCIDEILDDLAPARGVRDFRMKLQPVEPRLRIFDRGVGRILGGGGRAKALRQRRHLVPVAVPDIELFADPGEKMGAICHVQHARAVLAPGAEFHLPAEMLCHELHPVADAEHRDAQGENLRINLRRPLIINTRRPAGEHDAVRLRALRLPPR